MSLVFKLAIEGKLIYVNYNTFLNIFLKSVISSKLAIN